MIVSGGNWGLRDRMSTYAINGIVSSYSFCRIEQRLDGAIVCIKRGRTSIAIHSIQSSELGWSDL